MRLPEAMYTPGMRRTQIYLEEDVDRELRAVAAAEGRSAADLIREALRRYLAERKRPEPDPILAMAGTIAGLPRDAAAEHDRDLYGTGQGRRTKA
jgi:plasmid stability protein